MTYDENTVSDLHKDAFGFRPSQSWWENWSSMTPDAKQAEWDSLIVAMEASVAREKEDEARAIEAFEIQVTRCQLNGAKSREMALSWLMEASTADGDWEYFCFLNGLPYHYFKKAA